MLVGDTIPVVIQLGDAATDKFLKAYVFNAIGAALPGSPVNLNHVANGLYVPPAQTFLMPSTPFAIVQYLVFLDAARLIPSPGHQASVELWPMDTSLGNTLLDLVASGPASDAALVGEVFQTGNIEGQISEPETMLAEVFATGNLVEDIIEPETLVGEIVDENLEGDL